MLKVAVAKSVEAGLLPRRALKEDFQDAQILMRAILQSTLDSADEPAQQSFMPSQSSAAKTEASPKKPKLVSVELQHVY
ncbi:MAG: hypothetical protein ACO1NO_13290 [Burkholderiaceae bacterium]